MLIFSKVALDVEKLPEHVTEGMNILYMSHIDEVLKQAIVE